MYLAGRKVKGRGFHSGYDKLLPDRLPDEELLKLVQRLRNGDATIIDDVILQYLPLTISIVGRYVASFPTKSDDLMGVAALTLTKAVQKFPLVAENDNLAAYITGMLHGKIGHFLQEEDHTIQVTTRGFERAKRRAKRTGASVSQCLPHTISYDSTDEAGSETLNSQQAKDVKNVKNVSTSDDQTSTEIAEILERACFTRFEMLVYERLVQGMKETDIARELKYCKQRINQVKKDVIEKLRPYYGDTFK